MPRRTKPMSTVEVVNGDFITLLGSGGWLTSGLLGSRGKMETKSYINVSYR